MATEYDLIIINGVVVTDTEIGDYDIAVKDEKIAKVVARGGLKDAKAEKTIDAEGGYVMVCLSLLLPLRKLTSDSQEAWMDMFICKSPLYSARDHPQIIMRPVAKPHFAKYLRD